MSRQVLVIDDDEAIRETVQLILEDEGYKVTTEGDAQTALKRLETMTPDIIVTDLVMPGMNGYAFLNALQQRRKALNIPIIIFTASTNTAQEVEQIEAAGFIYIPKPFEIDELLTTINDLLCNSGLNSRG